MIKSFRKSVEWIPQHFIFLFSLFIGIRLIAAVYLPLADASESRYAEIARKMVVTGDWITLHHSYGLPFWAKPPLSTWISALGMSVLGIHPFAARLPVLLTAMGIIWFVMNIARSQRQNNLPRISALILFTGAAFYIVSAAVMTDMALIFGTTLSMIAFWHVVRTEAHPVWKYAFVIGVAVGLLANGPVSLVFIGFPIFRWGITHLTVKELWQKFPWVLGTLLVTLLVVPWYILAELKTPGFLHYFFVGEHFNRFLVSEWTGDLYGLPHPYLRGAIWAFWLLAALPWSLWFIAMLYTYRHHWRALVRMEEGWIFYLLLWAFTPMLFFTFSRNIILTYPLPGMPAFALLIGYYYVQMQKTLWVRTIFLSSCLLMPALTLYAVLYYPFEPSILKTQKEVIALFTKETNGVQNKLIYYCGNCHSAEFYSNGKVPLVRGDTNLQKILDEDKDVLVAIRHYEFSLLPPSLRESLQPLQTPNAYVTVYKLKEHSDGES